MLPNLPLHSMKARLYNFYFDIISKRKKGLFAAFLRALLLLFSGIYWLGLFFARFKKPYRPKAYTISIGNIVAGGTGKTPFTIFLANQLVQKHSVAILLRGYKSAVEQNKSPFVFQKEAPAHLVGDEACLIAKRVPNATLYCSKYKAESAKLATQEVIIIDDGFQHNAIERDFDIVMIDSINPFGYNHLLPRGLLREPISALKRADLIVITCRNEGDIAPSAEELIRKNSAAPICKVRFKILGLFDLQNRPYTPPKGTKVALFSAIAKPEQFMQTAKEYGLDIVLSHFLPDHASFSDALLTELGAKADILVCTEKDAVKITNATLPIYSLNVDIEMIGENNIGCMIFPA